MQTGSLAVIICNDLNGEIVKIKEIIEEQKKTTEYFSQRYRQVENESNKMSGKWTWMKKTTNQRVDDCRLHFQEKYGYTI